MKGLISRIKADIEEVNHDIKVDLGLEQPAIEEQETIENVVDVEDPEMQPEEETEDESDEAKAFGKVLDKIWEEYHPTSDEERDMMLSLEDIINNL